MTVTLRAGADSVSVDGCTADGWQASGREEANAWCSVSTRGRWTLTCTGARTQWCPGPGG
jgi:hypothetical protein